MGTIGKKIRSLANKIRKDSPNKAGAPNCGLIIWAKGEYKQQSKGKGKILWQDEYITQLTKEILSLDTLIAKQETDLVEARAQVMSREDKIELKEYQHKVLGRQHERTKWQAHEIRELCDQSEKQIGRGNAHIFDLHDNLDAIKDAILALEKERDSLRQQLQHRDLRVSNLREIIKQKFIGSTKVPVQLTLDFKANPDVAISGNSRPGNRAQSQRVIPRLSRRNTLPSTPATIFVLDHRDTDLMVRKYKFAKGGPNTEDSFARFQQNLLLRAATSSNDSLSRPHTPINDHAQASSGEASIASPEAEYGKKKSGKQKTSPVAPSGTEIKSSHKLSPLATPFTPANSEVVSKLPLLQGLAIQYPTEDLPPPKEELSTTGLVTNVVSHVGTPAISEDSALTSWLDRFEDEPVEVKDQSPVNKEPAQSDTGSSDKLIDLDEEAAPSAATPTVPGFSESAVRDLLARMTTPVEATTNVQDPVRKDVREALLAGLSGFATTEEGPGKRELAMSLDSVLKEYAAKLKSPQTDDETAATFPGHIHTDPTAIDPMEEKMADEKSETKGSVVRGHKTKREAVDSDDYYPVAHETLLYDIGASLRADDYIAKAKLTIDKIAKQDKERKAAVIATGEIPEPVQEYNPPRPVGTRLFCELLDADTRAMCTTNAPINHGKIVLKFMWYPVLKKDGSQAWILPFQRILNR